MSHYQMIVKQLYKEKGIRGLYRGYWATFWRDVPTYGLFFFVYEGLKKIICKDTDSLAVEHAKILFLGSFAGMLHWIPNYPFDLVKSTM